MEEAYEDDAHTDDEKSDQGEGSDDEDEKSEQSEQDAGEVLAIAEGGIEDDAEPGAQANQEGDEAAAPPGQQESEGLPEGGAPGEPVTDGEGQLVPAAEEEEASGEGQMVAKEDGRKDLSDEPASFEYLGGRFVDRGSPGGDAALHVERRELPNAFDPAK